MLAGSTGRKNNRINMQSPVGGTDPGQKLLRGCISWSFAFGNLCDGCRCWPIRFPGVRRRRVQVSDPYRHRRQPIRQLSFTANGPPVVQKNLKRPPHRYPASDGEALTQDFADAAALQQCSQKIAQSNGGSQHSESDQEACPPTAKEFAQTPAVSFSTLPKEFMNGIAQNGSLVGQTSLAIKIDEQNKRHIARQVFGSADNELLSVSIQVPSAKGSGVDRVEELFQLADVQLDHRTLRGNRIARGELIVAC